MSTSQVHSVEGSSGAELCRDRTFPTKHLSYLPRVHQLSPLSTVRVGYARVDQLDVCRQFIQQAAERGDNVGTDEYDDFMLTVLFGLSEIFVAMDPRSPEGSTSGIKAFIAIQPSMYARGIDKVVATIHVFRSTDIADDSEAYRSLVRLGVHLTSQIELGYSVCLMHATLACPTIMRALRAEDFSICCIFPRCINIAGVGVQENILLMKELGLPDRPPRPLSDIISFWNKFVTDNLPTSLSPLPAYDFLPRDYVFAGNLRGVVRNAAEADVDKLFEMMKDASEKGEGYSLNEFPCVDFFRRVHLSHNNCIVYEDKMTGDIIGFTLLGDSTMSRTQVNGISESYLIIAPKYRARGLFGDTKDIEYGIKKQTGRIYVVGETMISNARVLHIWRTDGISPVGVIPKSAYRTETGEYEETVVMYTRHDDENLLTFDEVVDRNAAQQKQKSVPPSKI